MRTVILSCLVFFSSFHFGEALSVRNITCSGSTLHDFRIQGCSEQPCRIRKGERLPFELDFSFTRPMDVSDNVYFNVFVPKYARPPATHGSSLMTGTCEKQNLGFNCPILPDVTYTLRSDLLIDSQAECTANCENMGEHGTGLKDTKWRWTIAKTNKRKVSKNHGDEKVKKEYSVCTFKVTFNIVE